MYACIDIGGTNLRIGLSKNLKKLDKIYRYPTPKTHTSIVQLINSHIEGKNIKTLAIGVPGSVDKKSNKIFSTRNVNLNKNISVKNLFRKKINNIRLENDAALAGLAESKTSIFKKYKCLAYITISTGVGGTLIENQKVINERYNFEPGHIIIEKNYEKNFKDKHFGTFEDLCSGLAFEEKYKVSPIDCTDKKIWHEYAVNLANGLANISILWQPDVIVLGGSLSKKSKYFLNTTKKLLKEKLDKEYIDIKTSSLDDTNVLRGGLALLKNI